MPPPPESQLAWLEVALEELPAFLSSSDAFRPLHTTVRGMVEDLSLGRLLLVVDALGAAAEALTPGDRGRWDRSRLRWETERSKRVAAIEAKAASELPHRVNLWRAFVSEMEQGRAESAVYPIEVRHRVVAARLVDSGARPTRTAGSMLEESDNVLRAMFEPGPFVWGAELERVYPPSAFWFLYGRPAPTR